jgi:3-isopropylmalate/(R)-2-methylmalate dehydratase small subunit
MPLVNIDTDMIIPKQFLKTIKRSGWGRTCSTRCATIRTARRSRLRAEPARLSAGQHLVAGDNFGCGSSREHAPWALADFGIRCVISTSFADIFFNNCFKNGILPIVLPEAERDLCMRDAEKGANARIEVDLAAQTVTLSDGQVIRFEVDPFRKHCLLNGLDDIGLTLEKAGAIAAFESQAAQDRPWV